MKILHYINNLAPGGAEKLLTDILPLFQRKGLEIHIAYSNNRKNLNRYNEIIERNGIIIHNFKMSIYNPLQVFKLIRLLKNEKYDIVHAHLFPTQYWLAFASLRISYKTRFIKTEHSIINRRRKIRILRPLEKWIYRRYNVIIAITCNVKKNLDSWLDKTANIVVINNGVNLREIELIIRNIHSTNITIFDSHRYNILMAGRFNYEKDQCSLIKALSLLPEHYWLFLAGGGNPVKMKHLVAELNLLKRVHFLGIREDIYKLMSLADLNVLSTNHEGLSGVALESMASGRPFIGTDVMGVNDIVPDNQFLFPRNDPWSLAAKIKEVSKNKLLEKHLIESGLEHVKKFDMNIMVDNYLVVYQSTFN